MPVRRLLALSGFALALALPAEVVHAQSADAVASAVEAVTPRVVAWRRDLHAHPELGFAETRTAAMVADHLRALGLEVRTGVGTDSDGVHTRPVAGGTQEELVAADPAGEHARRRLLQAELAVEA